MPDKQIETTKRFPLRVVLSVTTGRLLTEPKGPDDNGISDVYEILEWICGEPPFTHQLPRFGREARPFLLRMFPELAAAEAASSMRSLDGWLAVDRTGWQEAIKMWLAELRMMLPNIREQYDVPRLPAGNHESKRPILELREMMDVAEVHDQAGV